MNNSMQTAMGVLTQPFAAQFAQEVRQSDYLAASLRRT